MRGDKPDRSKIHQLAGNTGRRRHRESAAAAPLMDTAPPKTLKGIARATWKRLAAQLVLDRTLTELSVGHFLAYCQAEAMYAHMSEVIAGMVAKGEPLVEKLPSGARQQIPELGIQNRALEAMLKLGEMFAIDPYSRVRRGVGPPEPADDEADLLSQATGE